MIGPFGDYAEDVIRDDQALVFPAGDVYFVDVITLELIEVDGAHPTIALRNPGGDLVPAGDVSMTVFKGTPKAR